MARKPKANRYTDADKAAALDILKTDGLTAAAKAAGCAKSTVLRWAVAAGLDPAAYADRSTEQNRRAAAASAAARRALMLENRAKVSDDLLGKLAPAAIAHIADRLELEAELARLITEDEERLEDAIQALEVLNAPEDANDPRTIEERRVLKGMRADAREAVKDAMLILRAHRDSRTTVPELVGVFTRALNDHLKLEGEAAADVSAGSFAITFTAPRPDRTPGTPATDDIVTLPPVTQEQPA